MHGYAKIVCLYYSYSQDLRIRQQFMPEQMTLSLGKGLRISVAHRPYCSKLLPINTIGASQFCDPPKCLEFLPLPCWLSTKVIMGTSETILLFFYLVSVFAPGTDLLTLDSSPQVPTNFFTAYFYIQDRRTKFIRLNDTSNAQYHA